MKLGPHQWIAALAVGCALAISGSGLGSDRNGVTAQRNPAPKTPSPSRVQDDTSELDARVRYWTSDVGIARLQQICQRAMQTKAGSGLPFTGITLPAAGAGITGYTDFEEEAEPGSFSDTYPLLGARGDLLFLNTGWDGWDINGGNGGAVLNESYNAGVLARSGRNFLAFNSGAFYPNGVSVPVPPNIVFGAPATILGGFFSGGTASEEVVLICFSEAGLTGFKVFDTLVGDWELQFIGTGNGARYAGMLILGGTTADWSIVIDDMFGYNF